MHINQLLALGTGLLSASILVTAQQQSGDANGGGGGGTQSGNSTSSDNGPQVQLTSANDFCLFLPPKPGLEVAVNEDNGIPFCMNPTTVPGSQPFPHGFVTTAHFQQTETYTQITGFFDRTKYNLSQDDGGGQYDSHANHKPTGGSCQNFPYFVSMIEPSNNRFCIRCCQNTDDCKTGISQNGCQRVVTPGNYDDNNAFDAVPPSDANDGSADASGSSGASASASASGPTASASGNGNGDSSSAGTGDDGASTGAGDEDASNEGDSTGAGDDEGTTASEQDDHSNQMDSQELPNTSYNSVLDELDTASSQGDTSGTGNDNSSSSTSSNGSDVKTVEDEAKYIQSQLQNPQVDVNALKTQFSTFTSNLSTQFPEAADIIKQLEMITSSYQTAEQWQHLTTVLQQKAPGASDASSAPPAASGAASGN